MSEPLFTEEEWQSADELATKRRELQVESERARVRNVADVRAREKAPHRSEALQLEKRTGIPWDVAERNVEKIRSRDAYQKLSPVRVENSPAWADFMESPLAPMALAEPENTRFIGDAIELRALGNPKPGITQASLESGMHMIQVAKFGFRDLTNTATSDDQIRFHGLRKNWPEEPASGILEHWYAEVVKQAPVQADIATWAAASGVAGGVMGLRTGKPRAALGTAGTAAWMGTGLAALQLEGGLAWSEALDIAEEVKLETGEVIDPAVLRGAALLVGGVNAGIEMIGMKVVWRVTGLAGIQRRITRKILADIIKTKTIREHLIQFGKRATKALATEGLQEGVQESVNIGVMERMVELFAPGYEGPLADFWSAENVSRIAVSTLTGSAVGFTYAGAAHPIVAGWEGHTRKNIARLKAAKLDAQVEGANSPLGTKLREADPVGFRRWIQGMVENSFGDPNLYIDASRLTEYFQENNIDPESLRDVIPDVLDQLPEALEAGADVVIPISDYTTYLNTHHEGLKPHVRHGVNAPSPAEVDETAAEAEADLEADLERLADLREGAVEPTVGERIEQTILQRFVSEGIYSPRDARWQALLYRSAIETRIERKLRGESIRLGRDLTQEEVDVITEDVATQALFQPVGPEGAAPRPTLEQALERIGIDTMLNELRRGIQPELAGMKKYPILDVLKAQGGVDPDSPLAGDLRNMGITARSVPGLYRKGGAGALDAFDFVNVPLLLGDREAGLAELGSQPTGRIDDAVLLDAIDAEFRQESPLRTEEEIERIQERQFPREQLQRVLDQLDIDLQTTTNEEVADLLAEHYRATTLEQAQVDRETVAQRNLRKTKELADSVEGRSTSESNKHGLMPHLRVPSQVPVGRDKPLFAQVTMNSTAVRQLAAIDEVLARHPEATASAENWSAMLSDALASADVPAPPYAFIANINGTGAVDLLSGLSPGQIEAASHGFANAQAFRDAYISGEISVEDTGRLFMWGFLSRGVSPYVQESLFIDAFEGIGQWITAAADGSIRSKQAEYKKWAQTVAQKGSGRPGVGAAHNLNAFGKTFLFKMSEDAGDGSGRSRLQLIHDMMSDPDSTGPEIRRKFQEVGQGIGIDNKVVSFALLVAGFTDVIVLDRVQIREMWNDGRFGDMNLYDGFKDEGKVVTGSGLANLLNGARGLLIYEALERGLAAKVAGIYSALGRPDDASLGRYHWESWDAASGQEAAHDTIDALLAQAQGQTSPLEGVMSKEGEYGAYAYGARYGIDGSGVPYFLYSVPGVSDYTFAVDGFTAFLEAVKKPKNGVVPTKFKVTESGNAAWFLRPEVNIERLAELAEEFGERYEADEIRGADARSGVDPPTTNRLAADQPDAPADRVGDPLAPTTTLEQAAAAKKPPRGSLQFSSDLSQIVMRFTEARNLSTGLHEMGHLFFAMMMQDVRLEGTDPALATDMQTTFDYFALDENKARALKIANKAAEDWANEKGEPVPEVTMEHLEAALAAGLEVDSNDLPLRFAATGFHEVWAKSFEAFLREGKAPSVELQRAFDRFKVWLFKLYRSLRQLDVELSPEIRDVFDRMLATEEQIAQVRAAERMQPKFDAAAFEALGLTEEEAAKHQADFEQEAAKADAAILAKVLAENKRELTKKWKAEYERIHAQAEADINSQPAYRLRHWLQNGTMLGEEDGTEEKDRLRLDRDTLVQLYGGREILELRDPKTGRLLLPSGPNGVWQKNGVDPEELAGRWGFSSGDALVRALLDTINRKDAIDAEADRRMREIHGDILHDGTLGDLVFEELEGDKRGAFLMREMRLLSKGRPGLPGTPQANLRAAARRMVAGKTYRQLRPDIHRRSERRAAREMLDAIAAQDWVAAHKAGTQELLSHFLVIEATRARERAELQAVYNKRFSDKKLRKRIGNAGNIVVSEVTNEEIPEGQTYLDRIDDILDRFDFRNITAPAAARRVSLRAFLDKIKKQSETEPVAVPAVSPELVAKLESRDFRKPWKDLTVSELNDVSEALKSLEHTALLKGRLLDEQKQRTFEDTKALLLQALEDHKRTDKPLSREPRSPKEKISWYTSFLAELSKATRQFVEFDGEELGPWFDHVRRRMDTQGVWEHKELMKAGEAMAPLFDRFTENFMSRVKSTLNLAEPEIYRKRYVKALDGEYSMEALLQILLNLGNDGNRQRLQSGYGFTPEQIRALIYDPDVFTKEDFQWAQKVWDFIGSYWDLEVAKQKRVEGVAPERVEAVPLETPFGTLPGGYIPISYDRMQQGPTGLGTDIKLETLQQQRSGGFVSAVTRHGFLEARAAQVEGVPVRLDFGVIFEHISGVIHDLAWHEWLLDTNKILRDPEIALAIKAGYGHEVFRVLERAMESIAAGDVAEDTAMNSVLNFLRHRGSASILAHNLKTILLQYTGLIPAMEAHGAPWIARGAKAFAAGDRTWEQSTNIVMRSKRSTSDMNREMRELRADFLKTGVSRGRMLKFAYYGIIFTQSHTDKIVWLGVYEKEMTIGSGDHQRAMDAADAAVNDTQGSGQIKDLSELQTKNAATKMLTMFMSYANVLQQREALAYRRLRRRRRLGGDAKQMAWDYARFAGSTQMIFFVSELVTTIAVDVMRNDWDEDESWGEYLAKSWLFGGLASMANVAPVLREGTGFLSGFNRYEGPPGLRIVPTIGRAITQLGQLRHGWEGVDAALGFAALDMLGAMTGFPSNATKNLIKGVDYMIEEESGNVLVTGLGPPRNK